MHTTRERMHYNVGFDNPQAKLEPADIPLILDCYYKHGFTLKEIAAKFDVSLSTIHRVITKHNKSRTG